MASITPTTSTCTREIQTELPNLIRVYKDGSVERFFESPIVPPSSSDSQTGVSSKDVVTSDDPSISVRLYLPNPPSLTAVKSFPSSSTFTAADSASYPPSPSSTTATSSSSPPKQMSLPSPSEYRLAPEHPLPAAFEDCWASLKWVSSHSTNDSPITATDQTIHQRRQRRWKHCTQHGAEDLPGGEELLSGLKIKLIDFSTS